MKLLFDENLSRKLVARLAELYPDSLHVADAGLLQSPDSEIWEFARAGGFVIVTADSTAFSSSPGPFTFTWPHTPTISRSTAFGPDISMAWATAPR